MIRFFLTRVLAWFASISWKDFMRVVTVAEFAADAWRKSNEMTEAQKQAVNQTRAGHVRDWILDNLEWLNGSKLNLVLELAVNWFNSTKTKTK